MSKIMIDTKRIIFRSFKTGRENEPVIFSWPLDEVNESGMRTVPGFVLEISGAKSERAKIKNKDNFRDLLGRSITKFLNNSGVRSIDFPRQVIVEWYAKPDIGGLSRTLNCFDLGTTYQFTESNLRSAYLLARKRFIEQFSANVYNLFLPAFITIESQHMARVGCSRDWDLPSEALEEMAIEYMLEYKKATSESFPINLNQQLEVVISRIYTAWQDQLKNEAASDENIWLSICMRNDVRSTSIGLSGSGILFHRLTGENVGEVYGYYSNEDCLADIEAGLSLMTPISEALKSDTLLADDLKAIKKWLKKSWPIPLQIDFVRNRSGILVDRIIRREPKLSYTLSSIARAVKRNSLDNLNTLLAISIDEIENTMLPSIDPKSTRSLMQIASGVAAAPGAYSGILCTDPRKASELARTGNPVVFCSYSPAPELIAGILSANALVFATGGATSHVAVIARGSGKPCVLGVGSFQIDPTTSTVRFGDHIIRDGEKVTVDGTHGLVYSGTAEILYPSITRKSDLDVVLAKCDRIASVRVFVNGDTMSEINLGLALGAQGIGLCRLERLLTRSEALQQLQRTMALAWCASPFSEGVARARADFERWPSSSGAQAVLADASSKSDSSPIYRLYQESLESIYSVLVIELAKLLRCVEGMPVGIRLVDPPISEFLSESSVRALSLNYVLDEKNVKRLLDLVERKEPMLGLRGIRLCNIAPDFTIVQVKSIFEAARIVSSEKGYPALIDIIAPFVIDPFEVSALRNMVDHVATELHIQSDTKIRHRVGCMIETPRAALLAGQMAKVSDFLSIGTNDLTQFVWASSRDYAETDFLGHFVYSRFGRMPFIDFDTEGVGGLVSLAIAGARSVNPYIDIGLCGQHANSSSAMEFFHNIGVNYVSCSPQNIPVARLALAQAAIKQNGKRQI